MVAVRPIADARPRTTRSKQVRPVLSASGIRTEAGVRIAGNSLEGHVPRERAQPILAVLRQDDAIEVQARLPSVALAAHRSRRE